MAVVNMNNLLNGKDSRWLQLEVCREYQRNKCTRPDTDCKFAHPAANVEVQNGRVTACYDSIKVLERVHRDRRMALERRDLMINQLASAAESGRPYNGRYPVILHSDLIPTTVYFEFRPKKDLTFSDSIILLSLHFILSEYKPNTCLGLHTCEGHRRIAAAGTTETDVVGNVGGVDIYAIDSGRRFSWDF
ncbi:hypothetical protein QTP88_020693 [Uroleucon formosanum]